MAETRRLHWKELALAAKNQDRNSGNPWLIEPTYVGWHGTGTMCGIEVSANSNNQLAIMSPHGVRDWIRSCSMDIPISMLTPFIEELTALRDELERTGVRCGKSAQIVIPAGKHRIIQEKPHGPKS